MYAYTLHFDNDNDIGRFETFRINKFVSASRIAANAKRDGDPCGKLVSIVIEDCLSGRSHIFFPNGTPQEPGRRAV